MNYYKMSVFEGFHCVGSECLNTCCANWSIYIDNQSAEYYFSVPGEFGEKLKENIGIKENKYYFKLLPNGRCPFLDSMNLCEIYRHLGEDKMCLSCKQYPRTFQHITDNDSLSLINISCPEAAKMLFLSSNPISISVTNLGNEKLLDNRTNFKLQTYLNGLLITLQILQTNILSASDSIKLAVFFNDLFESTLRERSNPNGLFQDFMSEASYKSLSKSLNQISPAPAKLNLFLYRVCQEFTKLENMPYLKDISEEVLSEAKLYSDDNEFLGGLLLLNFFNRTDYETMKKRFFCYEMYLNYLSSFANDDIIDKMLTSILIYLVSNFFLSFKVLIQPGISYPEMIFVLSKIDRDINHSQEIKKAVHDIANHYSIHGTKDILEIIV